jgi:hypothetical protein
MNIRTSYYLPALSVVALLFSTMPFCLYADDQHASVSGAEIADYGIYRRSSKGEVNAPETNVGHIHAVASVELVQRTEQIPATLDTSFGIRYRVSGNPNGAIIQGTVNVIHPETKNPESGKTTAVDQWPFTAKLGKLKYTGWHFDHLWELVPGKWTIQLIYRGKVIAEKQFEVQKP